VQKEEKGAKGVRRKQMPPHSDFNFLMGECVTEKTLKGMFARQAITDMIQLYM